MLNSADLAALYELTQSRKYDPEDLKKMQQAFVRLCSEHPQMAETPEQRALLAKSLIGTYQHQLSQTELVNAALHVTKRASSSKGAKDPRNQWQDLVDIEVATLEKRTGLKLTGLSEPEIMQRVRDWLKAKQAGKSSVDG